MYSNSDRLPLVHRLLYMTVIVSCYLNSYASFWKDHS